ncbi:MAG TPA: hypothetical protein VH475_11495 [Tepidisphaeraceae bacterium]
MGTLGFVRPRTYDLRPRVWIERLEPRRFLSVTVEDGLLIVRGTDGPDDILIQVMDDADVGGRSGSDFGTGLAVLQDDPIAHTGLTWNFNRDKIRGILVDAGAGRDALIVEDRSGGVIPMTLLGGDGDDTLVGGAGDDLVDGQGGNDSISGGGGNDTLPDAPWINPGQTDVLYDRLDRPVATVSVIDGVLTIRTSDANDDVMVGTQYRDPSQVYVSVNDVRRAFDRATLVGISIDAGEGDDSVCFHNFSGLVDLPTTIDGGAGNDEIASEGNSNYLGDRIVFPGDGPFAPAVLRGGTGDDRLFGGIGASLLQGGDGDDSLSGGTTDDTLDGGDGLDLLHPYGWPTEIRETNDPLPPDADQGGSIIILDDVLVDVDPITPSVLAGEPQPTPSPAAPEPTPTPSSAPTAAAAIPIRADNPLLSPPDSLLGQRDADLWTE